MSDSKPAVKLAPNVWTDLYAETSIAVGTELVIYHHAGDLATLAIKATEPTNELAGALKAGDWYKVPSGVSGVWVKSVEGCVMAVQGG